MTDIGYVFRTQEGKTQALAAMETIGLPDDPVAVPVVDFSESFPRHNDGMFERQQSVLVGFILHMVCYLAS
jgi:hypothetical protein